MDNLTRILRLRDAEIWEYEFLDNKDIIVYFSITDLNRKATIHDNPLALKKNWMKEIITYQWMCTAI
ncbi:hypothetical protein [Bacillus altitudinis]|uniref:hypothetical protein n=1 Tax=Bacillus altitudinis TaxID=293387 RepID=UPI000DBBE9D9|nr:hypothetical protein [Bacillus altitudinis]SPR91636.1 hypothetical protein PAE4_10085 [Bacillus altitudinis]